MAPLADAALGANREMAMDEDRFNMAVRKFLKEVGVTSQREIERVVRAGLVQGKALKVKMTLSAENAPLQHTIVETIDVQ
jgi:hypothetical protein